MKTNNHDWMKPVLTLVKKHAPHTYEAMINADWNVTAVISEEDLLPLSKQISEKEMDEMLAALNKALGVTVGKAPCGHDNHIPKALRHRTLMNHRHLVREALEDGMDPMKLAATVLVHEWTHRKGYGEKEAYAAGAEFADKMGEYRIAESQRRKSVKHEREAELQREFEELLGRFGIGAFA